MTNTPDPVQTYRDQFVANEQRIGQLQKEIERVGADQLKLIGKLELLEEQRAEREASAEHLAEPEEVIT